MIRSTFVVLSQWVVEDKLTWWLISIYNILEKIISSKYPIKIPSLYMTSFIERNKTDKVIVELECKLLNNDKILSINKLELDFKNDLRHKRINVFHDINIEESWNLSVSLFYEWKEINRYSIFLEEKK